MKFFSRGGGGEVGVLRVSRFSKYMKYKKCFNTRARTFHFLKYKALFLEWIFFSFLLFELGLKKCFAHPIRDFQVLSIHELTGEMKIYSMAIS